MQRDTQYAEYPLHEVVKQTHVLVTGPLPS